MSKLSNHQKAIEVGTEVVLARSFLRSVGAVSGDLPFDRGTVTAVHPVNHNILTVQWDIQGETRVARSALWPKAAVQFEPN